MVEETNILSEMCHGRTRDSYSLCGTVARCEQYACGWTEHLSSVSSGTRNDSRKCVSASPPSPHTAAYNRYGYNDRNELTTAYRYLGDDLEDTDDPVPNEHFKYDYDPIGNRRGSWMGPEGEDPIISTDYGAPSGVANSLNQYDRVSSTAGEGTQAISNWIEHDEDGNLSLKWLVGDMNCDGQVNVLDNNAFTLALSDPPAYAAQFPNCQIINADVNNDGYINILDITAYVYLVMSGNAGGYTRYVWDAENRLIEVRPAAAEEALAGGITRSEYAYDYLGRRVIKRVYTWDESNDEWDLTLDRRFVYDGWLLLLELDGLDDNAVIRKYTWGLDLAGLNAGPSCDRQRAGGIGGLLAIEQASGVQSGYSGGYLYCYDANGNVTQVLDADTGAIAVKYEYDPYGNRVNADTSVELDQPLRFETRFQDAETGLAYWLLRYYLPIAGRWLNRDPLQEAGALNLYEFVGNAPLSRIDPLGLDWFSDLSNFVAGIGDSLSFGLTREARKGLNFMLFGEHQDAGIDHEGWPYRLGEATEVVVEIAVTAGGATLRHVAKHTVRHVVEGGARDAFRKTHKLVGGIIHHVNPIIGHPGGRLARFPLPFRFAARGFWNMTWISSQAAHIAQHRRLLRLEGLDRLRESSMLVRWAANELSFYADAWLRCEFDSITITVGIFGRVSEEGTQFGYSTEVSETVYWSEAGR
ncbi:tRNA(Glu)-specific nuclease WapA precursor [Phycisphaerae bacterium RAS1]|nr:tRNA(Glu)-specific nuclease WapA precursor [Phycisphaerae bacterium RAS1]